jgi:NAD-dependent deacetylase
VNPTFEPALLAAFRAAEHVLVLTGAGTSAESGVPTFRDAQSGLWAQFRPEELATRNAFDANPRRVWEWYAYRRGLVAQVEPNAGHRALAELESRVPRCTLVTQNVDGLHQRAGSRLVLELHGSLSRTKCFEHDHAVDSWAETGEVPPRCPVCGGRLRPDVVWFGEDLPAGAFAAAETAARDCDVCLVVGTASVVYPAALLPEIAADAGAVLVEANVADTPLTPRAAHALRGPAGTVLPALVQAVWPA